MSFLIWILMILPVIYIIVRITLKLLRTIDVEEKMYDRKESVRIFNKYAKKFSAKADKNAKRTKKAIDNFVNSDY